MTQQTKVVFDGEMFTCYGMMFVEARDCPPMLAEDAFQGQSNGLCGGITQGGLFLMLGIHTGEVPLTIRVHEQQPAVDNTWEEIVEASCHLPQWPIYLMAWGGKGVQLDMQAGSYRARFSGTKFGRSEELRFEGESGEHYLLDLWPAPPKPDAVLKVTTASADYWHSVARKYVA